MLGFMPGELIIMCCDYLTFYEIEELAWCNRRMMMIVRRNSPLAMKPRIFHENVTITGKSSGELMVSYKFTILKHKDIQRLCLRDTPNKLKKRKSFFKNYSYITN